MSISPFKDRFGKNLKIKDGVDVSLVFNNDDKSRPSGYNPHVMGYVTGSASGSNTTEIDQFRQGISIKNDYHRTFRTTPFVNSGRQDHVVEVFNHGQQKDYRDDTVFQDIGRLDLIDINNGVATKGAVSFIDGLGNMQMYPIVRDNPTYTTLDNYDGVIEPLTIRTRAHLTALDLSYESHDIHAHIMDGNIDNNHRANKVVQMIELNPQSGEWAFFDAPESFGDSQAGSIKLPDPLFDDNKKINPFKESKLINKGMIDLEANTINDDLESVLKSMSPETTIYPPPGFKSSTSGVIFDTPQGTDSIAFGGLRYYA